MNVYQLLDDPTAVLRLADGVVIHFDATGLDADWMTYQAWLAEGNAADPIPTPAPSPVILALDYIARFTNAEMDALHGFALTNPPTAQSLAVFKFLVQTSAYQRINLASTRITQAHALMVTRGFLTAQRSAAILTP